ncbi:MAG: rod shape-determining protein MreC [Nitrospinae bacterium]|nr:rod shape-determining protein MreC [Nitrospinota bacterium]
MLEILQERRNATLLTALFLVCFVLMSLSARRRGGTTVFEEIALGISGPLVETAAAPKRWMSDIWNSYIALRGLREENDQLLSELASLRGISVRAQELQSRVKRLEELLGGVPGKKDGFRLAQIVGRNQSPYGKILIIDQGRINGIRRNMPVLHQKGIVGRIFRAGQTVSQVLLITDSRNSVDVIVQRTREQGVFSISARNEGEVRYIPADADVKEGDLLISSGLGGIFPKGLPVARVLIASGKGKQLFQKVRATPTVNFNKLEEVLIVLATLKDNPWK